jgi:phosphatidylglycerol:prolipoprotein diacylglycerol transferase
VITSVLAVIRIDIDPVIHLGSLNVHWYGVGYAVAFWAGWRFGVSPYLTRRGVPQATVDQVVTWSIVVGLIGARLYYDVQNRDRIHNLVDVIAVWNGGMAFFGAIISVFALLLLLAWRHRISYWLLADATALFGVIGQPIGRIGNIINGDILGDPSNLPWATEYVNPNAVLQSCCRLGVAYQPAAAYEALATILIGVLLFGLLRRGVRPGVLAITYLAAYSVSQIVVFFWRASEPTVLWGLKQAQWTGIVMLAVAVPVLIVLWRRYPPSLPTEGEGTEPGESARTTPSGAMA